MKYLNIICTVSLLMAACSSNSKKTEITDSTKTDSTVVTTTVDTAAGSRCFLLTEGKTSRDSTSIEFAIKGNKLTGQMNWLPYQKDKREGTLNGTVKGDTINAVWSFMQEDVKDTIGLKFMLNGSQLMQKPLTFDKKTGREHTDENAGFTVVYKETGKVKN